MASLRRLSLAVFQYGLGSAVIAMVTGLVAIFLLGLNDVSGERVLTLFMPLGATIMMVSRWYILKTKHYKLLSEFYLTFLTALGIVSPFSLLGGLGFFIGSEDIPQKEPSRQSKKKGAIIISIILLATIISLSGLNYLI